MCARRSTGEPEQETTLLRKLGEIAQAIGAEVDGDPELAIQAIMPTETAGPEHLTYLAEKKSPPAKETFQAGAIIVGKDADRSAFPGHTALVRSDNPYASFARALNLFYETPRPPFSGISELASIDDSAQLGEECHVAAGVFVGPGAILGSRVVLHPGVSISNDVVVGDDVELFPRVTIYPGCRLGSRVIAHAGAVIGSDGFGFAPTPEGGVKIPHSGSVIIEDDVEIGANTAIDRGALDDTIIGRGTKIDNLVQVGHNCVIGPHSIICGQVGLAGSSVIGQGVMLGGQVGLAGHLSVGDGAQVGAKSGVHSDVPAGAKYFGYPATDLRTARRALAILYQLPELRQHVDRIGRQLDELLDG